MTENTTKEINEFGSVRIADEVVAIISGIAATEVAGVAGMSGGIAGGIAEMLGKKNLSKGVKVKIEENETFIDLYMIANYGVKIHDVSREVQEKVKQAVENMTGLNVGYINVHIQGIKFAEEQFTEVEEINE
ncbi:MAG: Asp23/Gls24 family envelope stress response protein [Firmicutes bacterium HGW-Firmicutes-13]|nr:MAG: Asp23/Gls24 family envelope stress response protein [Firmicutes bacterium HGW-Firmicutes-13]